jgi:hypothetical protein
VVSSTTCAGAAGKLQVIRTSNVRDVVVTVLGATGAWTTGDNKFVLEFDSAPQKRLIDVGAPTLTATLLAASSRPLRAPARLERADVPGRYVGTITLPHAGEWSVTVTWRGPGAKESTTFSIPVQATAKGAR